MRRNQAIYLRPRNKRLLPGHLENLVTWLRADSGICTGGALQFTAGDKVGCAAAVAINPGIGDFSVDFWFNSSSYAAIGVVFSTGGLSASEDGFAIYTAATTGKLSISLNDSVQGTNVSGAVQDANGVTGVWDHYVVTFNRDGYAQCYINGVLQTAKVDISGHQATLGVSGTTYIGRRSLNSTLHVSGSIAAIRYWPTLLDQTDATYLYNNKQPIYYGDLSDTYVTKLGTGHNWNCNESIVDATHNVIDQHGSNDLTFTAAEMLSNTGFETRTGRTSVSFISTDQSYLQFTAPPDPTTNDFSVSLAVYPTSFASLNHLLSTGGVANGHDGFTIATAATSGILYLYFCDSVEGTSISGAISDAGLTLNAWNDIVIVFDRDGYATCYINGTLQTAKLDISAHTDTLGYTSGGFVGKRYNTAAYCDARICQIGYWDGKLLDQNAVTRLRNGTIGQYYAELSATEKTGLTAFWDMTERSVPGGGAANNRNDRVGTNHLSEVLVELVTNGTFTEADGTSPPTGWTNNATYPWDTCDVQSNKMRLIQDATGPVASIAQQAVATVAGRTYSISYDVTKTSGNNIIVVYGGATGSPTGYAATHTSTATVNTTFTSSATGYLSFYSALNIDEWTVDNVSFKAANIPCVSDADIFGSWTESKSGSSTFNIETYAPGAGVASLRFDVDASENDVFVYQAGPTVGNQYIVSCRAKASAASKTVRIGNATNAYTLTTDYADYGPTTITASYVNGFLIDRGTSASQFLYVDNVSCKATQLYATNGPASAIASDSIGTNHLTLVGRTSSTLITDWRTDLPTALQCKGYYSLNHDGNDDYESIALANFRSGDSAGAVSLWYKGTDSVAYLFTVADEATDTKYHACGIIGGVPVITLNTGSAKTYTGATVVNDGTWHHLVFVSNGSALSIYVDSVLENGSGANSGEWYADYSTLDNVVIGALKRTGLAQYTAGLIADVRVYGPTFTPATDVPLLFGGQEAAITPVAQWNFSDGPQTVDPVAGDPIILFEDGIRLNQAATASYRPEYAISPASLEFDGVDDNMITTEITNFQTQTGTVLIAFKTPATFAAEKTLFGGADNGTENNYLQIGVDTSAKLFVESNAGGTVNRVTGHTALTPNTWYIATIVSDGSDWFLWVNYTSQSLTVTTANSGNWFADITGQDNITLGALITNAAAPVEPWEGFIRELIVCSDVKPARVLRELQEYAVRENGITV